MKIFIVMRIFLLFLDLIFLEDGGQKSRGRGAEGSASLSFLDFSATTHLLKFCQRIL